METGQKKTHGWIYHWGLQGGCDGSRKSPGNGAYLQKSHYKDGLWNKSYGKRKVNS